MDSYDKDGFEQVVQEQNDILRRFMEAEFARQAVLLKEIQHEISLRGDLPIVSLPAAASSSTPEPIQAQEVQEMVQAWNATAKSLDATAKSLVEEETDLLSSWHPKPDHSKAVPNPGLEHDDDTIPAASALATPTPATPLPETPNENTIGQERQISVGSGVILNQKLPKEIPVSRGRHDEKEKEHGGSGRSGRPSWTGSSSFGLGSQLKNMLHGHGHGHGARQSVTNEKKDLNEHQRRALRASGSFMSDKTAESNNGSASHVLRKVVTSSAFSYGIMFLILANMVILGVEVDTARHLPPDENPDYFFIINNSIVCLFVLEIILKLMAFGCQAFFCGRDRGWNIFDCIIVALSLVESASDLISRNMAAEASSTASSAPMDAGHLRVARFTRLIRALRGVRVVRLLRFVSSLRAILFSISSTIGSLAWTLLLLLIVFYCFGVIIAQLVSDHCRYHLSPEDPSHQYCAVSLGMWDGVLESMMTLFHSITGGLSWVEAFTPLREISLLAAAFMYLYIVVTVFAVLNVVTGVFCNTAIENAKADKDIAVMKQMQKHRTQVEALRTVFNDIDVNQSKLVNLNELKVAMEESKLSSFMESMDISTRDIWTLFMLIDADESGEISIDEFVAGCMQLQGPAKSIQLARLRHEHHLVRRDLRLILDDIAALKTSMSPSSAETKKK